MRRWSRTFGMAMDAVSQSYLDDLSAYARANPRITEGITVAVKDDADQFHAYGRVLKTKWSDGDDSHIASVRLYDGTACDVPDGRLERVRWPRSIMACDLKLHRHPCDR